MKSWPFNGILFKFSNFCHKCLFLTGPQAWYLGDSFVSAHPCFIYLWPVSNYHSCSFFIFRATTRSGLWILQHKEWDGFFTALLLPVSRCFSYFLPDQPYIWGHGFPCLRVIRGFLTVYSSNSTPGHISREDSNSKEYMHPSVHSSSSYISQDMEGIQVPINRQIDKEDVRYIHISVCVCVCLCVCIYQ